MIKLFFEIRGQYFFITIDNRIIKYFDKLQGGIWGGPLQYLPVDPGIIRKIDMSRNKIPAHMKEFFKVTDEDLKEYNDAKDDMELRDIVLKDTKKKGCKLIDMKIE